VLTGGGDAPGLNAVIRAVVKTAARRGIACVGIEDSFHGLIEPTPVRELRPADMDALLRLGGTILGTTNRGDPFAFPAPDGGTVDHSTRCIAHARDLGIDAIVAIGGDGTLSIAEAFWRQGLPLVGVPKTIDHDIAETDTTFGFDTAVAVAAEAVDRVRASAESHHRIMVIEVMGHHAGWLALSVALGAGADVALIPEIPFDVAAIADHIEARVRAGERFSLVVAADEARSTGAGDGAGMDEPADYPARLRDIGRRLAEVLERRTGREGRHLVVGHVQRGSPPTVVDRVLATRLGSFAVELIEQGTFGVMTAVRGDAVTAIPLERIVRRSQPLPPRSDLLRAAMAMGICLGRSGDA
jgi:6-phosphofructokinase 1